MTRVVWYGLSSHFGPNIYDPEPWYIEWVGNYHEGYPLFRIIYSRNTLGHRL